MKLSLFAVAAGFLVILGCRSDTIQNQWANHEITIDGKNSDWAGIAHYTLEDQRIVMGLTNDENNLYLKFTTSDERMARRVQMMGVTVWLNKEGKKKKDYGICYTGSRELMANRLPGMAPPDRNPGRMDETVRRMPERRRENLPGPGKIIVIEGSEKQERDEIAPEGPAAGSAFEDSEFCYEFKIPLPIPVKSGKKIKMGLEWGGMSQQDRSARQQGIGGMRGDFGGRTEGGMGGRPGGRGGMPGDMGGPPDDMRGGEGPPGRQGLEKQEVWFEVILAEKNGAEKQ